MSKLLKQSNLRATPCKYRPKCGKAQKIKIALLLHTGRLKLVYKRHVISSLKDPFLSEKNVENRFKPRRRFCKPKTGLKFTDSLHSRFKTTALE